MSVVKIKDLPPIAHHMNVIILGAMIENWHRNVVHQEIDPAQARELAIMYTMAPEDGDTRQRGMVEQSYRVTIRLYQAMEDLGLKHDKRNIKTDGLVFMGLSRR